MNNSNLDLFEQELLLSELKEKTGLPIQVLRPEKKKLKSKDQISDVILRLNKEYAVIRIEGKTVVSRTYRDVVTNSLKFDAMSFESFKKWFIGENIDGECIADIWLNSQDKIKYDQVIFQPMPYGQEIESKFKNCYNTWTGLAIEPKRGDWEKIESHINYVICNNNNDYAGWLLDWCAYTLQNLGIKKPKTAVFLQGGQGTGKGTFAKLFQIIFGMNHYIAISKPKQLTGNFNFLLMDKVFIYSNESFFAGNKEQSNSLKADITEPYRIIEKKYLDGFPVKNHSVYLFDSNSDWVLNAEHDDRRHTVFRVSEKYKKNELYFDELHHEIDNGGAEAFLDAMLKRKITHNVNKNIATEALKFQKMESFDLFKNWWVTILEAGDPELFGNKFDSEILFSKWQSYFAVNKHNSDRAKPKQIIAKAIKKIHPEFSSLDQERHDTGRRFKPWVLPSLETARTDFEHHIGHSWNW